MVFIPTHTWISLKNTGNETIGLMFIFRRRGSRMRCDAISCEGRDASDHSRAAHGMRHEGHAEYEDMGEKPEANWATVGSSLLKCANYLKRQALRVR
jgi:hypothetical protein